MLIRYPHHKHSTIRNIYAEGLRPTPSHGIWYCYSISTRGSGSVSSYMTHMMYGYDAPKRRTGYYIDLSYVLCPLHVP